MRIFYLIPSFDVGGAERQLILQASGLASRGHVVTVGTFHAGGGLEKLARASGLVRVYLLKARGWGGVPFVWRLLSTCRRFDADVVHGMLAGPNVLLALLKPFL